MNYFNKLPGYTKAKSGFEWVLLKTIPKILFLGTAFLLLIVLMIELLNQDNDPKYVQLTYLCYGLIFSHWFFVGAAAIGCVVVIVMKGPAYVADPYELPKENKDKEPFDL